MIRYAIIKSSEAPDQMPDAPVVWVFKIGKDEYIGLEWGDDAAPEKIDGWQSFASPVDFEKFTSAQ